MRRIKIDFNKNNLDERIQSVKEVFSNTLDFEYEFDLSRLNLIDASKVALILPAELMKKNTKSTVNCLLGDKETLNIISPRKLKNTFLSVTVKKENFNDKVREFNLKKVEQKIKRRHTR